MRVLVNFLPVSRGGGGLQNVRNLWRSVGAHGDGDHWLGVSRPGQGLAELDTGAPWATMQVWDVAGFASRITAENVRLPRLARSWGADVIFTPMGTGPLRGRTPTVIGWHDSTVAYPESPVWQQPGSGDRRVRWAREVYARAAARRAGAICVQTETMAFRLSGVWGLPESRFRIVSNGPSGFLASAPPAPDAPPHGPAIVLVIGEAKPTKNLEVVPAVADALESVVAGDVEIHLTEEPGSPFLGPLEEALRQRRGSRIPVRLIGQVPHARLAELYHAASVVLLPSLLESFSATYVEAMHFGVPLVTSDLDFARAVCGDAALYADPLDPVALAVAVGRVLNEPGVRPTMRRAGFDRVQSFPSWEERFALYREVCRSVAVPVARAA